MVKDIVFYALMFISLIYIIHIGLYITGANLYDIWQMIRRSNYKRPHRRKPLVSVVIPAHNEQHNIIRTLESVHASTYQKVEIIIVDDGSTDRTYQIVRDHIKSSPDFKVESYVARYGRSGQLYRRYIRAEVQRFSMTLVSQRNAGKGAAVNNGVQNYATGDIVMTLDADSILDSEAIANAVRYFDSPRVGGVAANVRINDGKTALGVLQKIEHLIAYRSKKFYTMTNCEFIVGGVASSYRADLLKEVEYYDTDTLTEDIGLSMKIVSRKGNRQNRIIYADDVLASTEGVQTYKALFKQRYRWKMGMIQNLLKYMHLTGSTDSKYSRMLTLYRIPMAYLGEIILLVEPCLLAYLMYMSIRMGNPFTFVGAYLTMTFYVIWTLLPDEHLTKREKAKYSALSPFMYFIFYIMNAVQIVAIIRVLFNHKTARRKIQTDGIWASPERAAAQVTAG